MKYKHPCKYCIVKPMCKRQCSIINDYIKQFNEKRFGYSIITLVSLLLILSYILLFGITMLSLVSLPFLWVAALILFAYWSDLNAENNTEKILIVLFLPSIMITAGMIYLFEKYINKYAPI